MIHHMQHRYFIWQLLAATSCPVKYCISTAHSAYCPHI